MRSVRRFIFDETGQATTEYVLLVALVVLPVAIAYNKLQSALRDLMDTLNQLVFGPGV